VDLQNCALTALERLGPQAKEAVPALVQLLDRPNAFIRSKSLRVLSRMGVAARPALPQLSRLTADPDESNRALALQALVQTGSVEPEVMDAIRGRLKDASVGIRLTALDALIERGEDLDVLLPTMASLAETAGIQQRLEVLRMIRGAGGRGVKALGIVAGRFGDSDPVARSTAAAIAGSLGPAASELIPALERLQGDPDPRVRLRAALALKQVR
jgi:HEAT repeat protein